MLLVDRITFALLLISPLAVILAAEFLEEHLLVGALAYVLLVLAMKLGRLARSPRGSVVALFALVDGVILVVNMMNHPIEAVHVAFFVVSLIAFTWAFILKNEYDQDQESGQLVRTEAR